MAGNQYAEANTAGSTLKTANKKLEEAKKAPYSSENARALQDAEAAQTSARREFDKKFAAYVESMKGQSGVKSESHFIS